MNEVYHLIANICKFTLLSLIISMRRKQNKNKMKKKKSTLWFEIVDFIYSLHPVDVRWAKKQKTILQAHDTHIHMQIKQLPSQHQNKGNYFNCSHGAINSNATTIRLKLFLYFLAVLLYWIANFLKNIIWIVK